MGGAAAGGHNARFSGSRQARWPICGVRATSIRLLVQQIGAQGNVWCNDNTYMSNPPRLLLLAAACLASTGVSRIASAWIETSITADTVTIEVDKSGQAIVAHELWMKIRGGPFKGTSLEGVDSDAEPLPGAQVEKIGGSGRAELLRPLLLSRGDDDSLYIEIDDSAGLRAGSYAFRFKYRTDLRQRRRIVSRGSWAELSWIGPRFPAGLDVAKVAFHLPYAASAPRLPESDADMGDFGNGGLPSDAMLSTLRRGADVDVLELVRPHVAKGEPVLWRLWTAPTSFPWLAESPRVSAVTAPSPVPTPKAPLGKGMPLAFGAIAATLFAIAAVMKDAAVRSSAQREHCEVRPFVPLRRHWRATAAGLLLAAAILLAARFDAPSIAALLTVVAQAGLAYRAIVLPRQLRGPGRWLPLRAEEALARSRPTSAGAWLDATVWQGKVVLGVWTLAWVGLATRHFASQPYVAVLALIAVQIPWPLFFTGTRAELPSSRRDRALSELIRFQRHFDRDDRLRVLPIGRFGEGDLCPDEVRLKLVPRHVPKGLVSLEIAANPNALHPSTSLLIRVRDESEAHHWLSQRFGFFRGRSADERVATYSPAIAARSRIIRQVRRIISDSSKGLSTGCHSGSAAGPATHPARSAGKGSNTSKPSRPAVPAQATRAA